MKKKSPCLVGLAFLAMFICNPVICTSIDAGRPKFNTCVAISDGAK